MKYLYTAKLRRLALWGASLVAMSGGAGAALAQDAPQSPNPAESERQVATVPADVTLSDIVVTARRRAENIQNVPLSIAAFSQNTLRQAGVTSALQLPAITPSLVARSSAGKSGLISFELRGISAPDIQLNYDPAVGVYVNEVIQTRAIGLTSGLFDIENVQVLYGPQGTLFGRNTVGGAVMIATRKPQLGTTTGEAAVTIGNYSEHDFEGILNLPIGSTFALRAAVRNSNHNGYTQDIVNHRRLDDAHDTGWRVSALWQPSDRFNNLLVVDGTTGHNHGAAYRLTAARPFPTIDPTILARYGVAIPTGIASLVDPNLQAALARAKSLPDHVVGLSGPLQQTQSSYRITNTTTFALNDQLTIKNIAAYLHAKQQGNVDLDGSPENIFSGNSQQRVDQFTEELQLQGHVLDDRLDFALGIFYLRESGDDGSQNIVFGNITQFRAHNVNQGKSVFAQGTYRMPWLEGLSLTAGIRYTQDPRDGTFVNTVQPSGACQLTSDNAGTMPLSPCVREQHAKFSKATWNVSLDYKWNSNLLTYVAHRHGYRSGGFNPRQTSPITAAPFKPETVDDIEIGIKGKMAPGGLPLTANASLYKTFYSDIQRTAGVVIPNTNPPAPATFIVNAGKATIQGLEAMLSVGPVHGFEITGNLAIADSKYTRFPTLLPGSSITVDGAGMGFGNFKTTWNISGTYSQPLGGSNQSLLFRALYTHHSSGNYPNIATPFDEPEGVIKPAGQMNLSVTWQNAGGTGVDVRGFVNNAFNKTEYSYNLSIEQLLGITAAAYAPPRTFGMELRAKF